jgi:hypothetical protein
MAEETLEAMSPEQRFEQLQTELLQAEELGLLWRCIRASVERGSFQETRREQRREEMSGDIKASIPNRTLRNSISARGSSTGGGVPGRADA